MRIDAIQISNILGLARADIKLSTPVLVVAGLNEAGKSTIADAISMAILGKPRRVAQKKELGQLLHEGAEKGRVTLTSDDDTAAEFRIPGGQHMVQPVKGAEYLPYVLEPTSFATIKSDERRSLLFKLTNCRAKPADIKARLIKRGCSERVVDEIEPALTKGFPGACAEAKEFATQAKGAWRSVTNENWGSDKAKGWEPEAVPDGMESDALQEIEDQLKQLDQDLADAREALGGSKEQAKAAEERSYQIEQLKESADLLKRREAKLKEDQARVDEWSGKLADAERAASGEPAHDPMQCPHCRGKVVIHNGDLAAYEEPKNTADPEAAKRATEYRGYLESAQRAVKNSERDVAASKSAADQLKVLQDQTTAVPLQSAIENAEQIIRDMRQERDRLFAQLTAEKEASALRSGRDKTIAKAAGYHEQVMQWLEVAEALSPSGIPAEILDSALAPFNDSLSVLAGISGWKKVAVSSDMEISIAGRAYGLCSESSRWRADAMIAIAISQISELRLTVLDRFDVLDLGGRGQLLGMLVELSKLDAMDTMIICGTMKELPARLPKSVTGVWVENGIAETGS
jgi:hypothetical protein